MLNILRHSFVLEQDSNFRIMPLSLQLSQEDFEIKLKTNSGSRHSGYNFLFKLMTSKTAFISHISKIIAGFCQCIRIASYA